MAMPTCSPVHPSTATMAGTGSSGTRTWAAVLFPTGVSCHWRTTRGTNLALRTSTAMATLTILAKRHSGRGTISWYENRGGARFSGERVIVPDRVYGSTDVVDLDDDGESDLLYTTTHYDHLVLWRENIGGGMFSEDRLIEDNESGRLVGGCG